MTERTWHKGPPPHVGWWNAVRGEPTVAKPNCWRWWNGKEWSFGITDRSEPAIAGKYATASWGADTEGIVWSDYYPEDARVPRVDPSLPGSGSVMACMNTALTAKVPKMWEEAAWKYYNNQQNLARLTGSKETRTVRDMKERVKPAPAALNPAYVPGSRLRLSPSVRAADVDFSGAQLRNAVCVATQDHRREDTPGVLMTHLRGKGTPVSNGQTPDPFAGITTLALMKEVFRRLG